MSQKVTYIPQHWIDLYNENFGQAVQQTVSRLRPYVTVEPDLDGERRRYDDLESEADFATEMTDDAGPTRISDSTSGSRWLYGKEYDDAKLIGQFDEKKMGRITAPRSDLLRAMMMKFDRTFDRIILDGLEGTVKTGKDGTGSSAFPAANIIAADFKYDTDGYTPTTHTGPTGLTVDKIREALVSLGEDEAFGLDIARDPETMPIMAASSRDLNTLFADIKATSADFTNVKIFDIGMIQQFLGVKFVRSEKLTTDATTRNCILWQPAGILFFVGDFQTYMDIRADRSHAVQVRCVMRSGAMRRYDSRVRIIKTKK